MTPTRRLLLWMVAGLGLAAMPIVVHRALWPLVFAGWSLVLVMSIADLRVLWCAPPTLSCTPLGQAHVGAEIQVKLSLEWTLWRETQCRIRAEVEAPLLPGSDVHVLLPPGQSQVTIALQTHQRGLGKLAAIWLELAGPLGMLTRSLRIPVDDSSIRVVPNLPLVKAMALQHVGAWQMRGGVRLERMRGDGSEFDTLESYTHGHDPRSIDWKASARHQKLTVQRFRVERNQRLVICMDTGHLMVEALHGTQRLDHAIHAGLLLSYFALRAGDLVGLYHYDQTPGIWLPPAPHMRSFQRINHTCAEIFAKDVETNHVLGLRQLLTRLERRTLVIVFSEFTHSTSAELMLESLEHLVRKHLVIFVSFAHPQIAQAFDHPPSSPEEMASAIVAHDLQLERKRVLQRLRRAGVHIVDGHPGLATLQLVARYTEIKRRELIG